MKLLLIDGNSIMNRGYFALPNTLTNSEGIHTNALLGFLNIFLKVYEEEKPTHIAVAFDVHEPTFRHKLYSEYKGNRKSMDPELREQFPIIKEILHEMGIKTVERGGYEADDILGTLAGEGDRSGYEVSVLSGDRDLLQLATDSVLIRIPKTKGGKTVVLDYHAEDVMTEYGVTPSEFIDMKGLMGDSSDNIPGVPGIGPKTASKIISEYHNIESALQNIDKVKPDKARQNLDEYREQALFSRELARIKTDCELDINVNDTRVHFDTISGQNTLDILRKYELFSVIKKLNIKEDGKAVQQTKAQVEDTSIEEKASVDDILIELNKAAGEDGKLYVGIFPVIIDGIVSGGAISFGGKSYIIRQVTAADFKTLIKETASLQGVSPSMLSVKEYIGPLNLEREDSIFDCSLAAYLINPLNSEYTYDNISRDFLKSELPDEKSLIGKSGISIFSYEEEGFRKLISYKAAVASLSCPVLIKRLEELGEISLYEEVEVPLSFVLHDMEVEGIGIDREALREYGKNLNVRIGELENDIYQLAGEVFNINSPKQLGNILFEKLGLPSGKKNKSGYSTSVDVLEKLAPEHKIVADILEYRGLTKLSSTYVEGLTNSISTDGRIHSTFNQKVTATGRISSTEPNLQNIPTRTPLGRELRRVFVPRAGYTYVDADYSQIELRVMAAMSGDETLISAFKEGKDIHAITASQVFGVSLSDVDSDLRRKAKAVNFGIIYGISSFGLSEDIGVSRQEAKEYKEMYFDTYSAVKDFLDEKVREAKNKGSVRTLYGRIRPIPEINNSNFNLRSFGERVAMNSPIQGTAADIIKIAMIGVADELKKRGLKSRLILQIHDELLIEAEDSELDEVSGILEDKMENAASLAVPLIAEVHTGSSLYEAK